MFLDEPEPVDSVLTFLIGSDTLEYYWVKATAPYTCGFYSWRYKVPTSINVEAGQHPDIQKAWCHWSVAEHGSIQGIWPRIGSRYEHRFVPDHHYQKMHVGQCPKIIVISPFLLQYQGKSTNLGSLGKEYERRIYLGGNSLSHRIVFSWDNAGFLRRRSAWQCVVEATSLVVALTSARVAIIDFATT